MKNTPHDSLAPTLEAIANLLLQELNQVFSGGSMAGHTAHAEIQVALLNHKSAAFYRHFLPLRTNLVSLLAKSYRLYFRVALAHPREAGSDPHHWAWCQLQPAISAVLEWIRDWYILACDGENRWVRHLASTEWVPGQTVSVSIPTTVAPHPPAESWRAPAWLFQVSLALFGIGLMKTEHVPERDSEQKLGAAHTRLLLTGTRRVFLWELGGAIERARNEEIAAAGAVPVKPPGEEARATKKAPKHWLKGFEGLGPKVADLSRYMHVLTDKQQMAFSLKNEYGLKLAEVASRMGLDRKTAYEHLKAADKKINEAFSSERRKARLAKNPTE